jgi:hypothetical protein
VAWDDLRRFIVQRFVEHCSVTIEDALTFLAERLGLHLLSDTLRKKVHGGHELRMIQRVPIEKKRLECDTTETRSYFEILNENITGVPATFIFNLDESGFQNWADGRERIVIVSSTSSTDRIEITDDRATKRSALLLCIGADGTWLKPCRFHKRKRSRSNSLNKESMEIQ